MTVSLWAVERAETDPIILALAEALRIAREALDAVVFLDVDSETRTVADIAIDAMDALVDFGGEP